MIPGSASAIGECRGTEIQNDAVSRYPHTAFSPGIKIGIGGLGPGIGIARQRKENYQG